MMQRRLLSTLVLRGCLMRHFAGAPAPPPSPSAQLGHWCRAQLQLAPDRELTIQQLVSQLPLDLATKLTREGASDSTLRVRNAYEDIFKALCATQAETGIVLEGGRGMTGDTRVRLPSSSKPAEEIACTGSTAEELQLQERIEKVMRGPLWAYISPKVAMSPKSTLILDLYQSLSREQRMTIRHECGSLLELLRGAAASHLIRVSRDGLRVTRVGTHRDDGSTALETASSSPSPGCASGGKKVGMVVLQQPQRDFVPISVEMEDIRMIYRTHFPNFTPPPAPANTSSVRKEDKKLSARDGVACAGVFTAEMVVPLIPTFFVPMEVVGKNLPEGYTVEHVRQVFAKTLCIETVTIDGDEFVRLHGGNQQVNLSGSYETNERFAEFAPNPFLCDHFVSKMPRAYKWVSLREVVEAADPAVEAQLPYHFLQSILFFAQMQHKFCFSAEGGGELCSANAVEQLSHLTSPTPAALNELCMKLAGGSLDSSDLAEEGGLSDGAKLEILAFFGNLENFCVAHGTVLHYCPQTRLVTLQSTLRAREKRSLPLEQQLEIALMKREKQDARKIRRKMAILRNPDNPLLDRAKLTEEVKRFLPRKHHISLRMFIRNLPPDMVDIFPDNQILFFKNQPEHFSVFEFKMKNKIHVMRAGIPLPDGHLRLDYTEDELVQMCAAILSEYPRRMCDLFSKLPFGAREVVRLRHKGLFEVLKNYPQYFTIVFKDSIRLDSRNSMVELVGRPPTLLDNMMWGNVDVPLTEADDGQLDEDALQLLQQRGGGKGGGGVTIESVEDDA